MEVDKDAASTRKRARPNTEDREDLVELLLRDLVRAGTSVCVARLLLNVTCPATPPFLLLCSGKSTPCHSLTWSSRKVFRTRTHLGRASHY